MKTTEGLAVLAFVAAMVACTPPEPPTATPNPTATPSATVSATVSSTATGAPPTASATHTAVPPTPTHTATSAWEIRLASLKGLLDLARNGDVAQGLADILERALVDPSPAVATEAASAVASMLPATGRTTRFSSTPVDEAKVRAMART